MFSTLYVNSSVLNRNLILTIQATNGWTSKSVTTTSRGINIIVGAKISSYSVEDSPGHWAIIPESYVPDGSRIIFNIDSFKPLSANQATDILVIRPDAVRKYMYIRIRATMYIDGLSSSKEKVIIINSNLQWVPSVSGLLLEPTSDDIYLSQAISQIETLGSSQIHDAVKMAAQRIIQFQTDFSNWKNSKKVIYLLTDGDENSSQYSINQSIDNVNFIDGTCKVPVIPIQLGYSYASDNILTGKYVEKTCGHNFYLIRADNTIITDVMNDIITSALPVNHGIYTNIIDLGKENLASSIAIESLLLPSGSRVLFRARFSADALQWSSWTEWYDSSILKDFSLDLKFKGRYFQYQLHLYGNENFESPEIYAGLTLCYYKVQNFTVFFQPIDLDLNTDEYVASIHITHKAFIPPTSTITYGYSQFDTTNINDYASVTSPWITPDRHAIILTRYNELFLTEDYQTYTAINGGWSDLATISIYRVNNTSLSGELVNSNEYAVNNKNGEITFYNIQNKNDKFVLCVNFDPVFRIVCNVVNYGPEPVSIDHIGLLYNISKRIPTDQNGNIIHTPVNMRLSNAQKI